MSRTVNRPTPRIPGYNVDRIDVAAGLRELKACGYSEPETIMVIEYALMRWARGEEEAAQRGAIDRSFHGINLTCWIRVLAAAQAHAEIAAAAPDMDQAQPCPHPEHRLGTHGRLKKNQRVCLQCGQTVTVSRSRSK